MSNIVKSYNDFAVTFEEMNNEIWFNATQAAKHFGKDVRDWLKLESTTSYIQALIKRTQTEGISPQLIRTKEGRGGGTWIHKKLVIAFARWLSDDFAVWCDEQIEGILLGKIAQSEFLRRVIRDVPEQWQRRFEPEFWEGLYNCWGIDKAKFPHGRRPSVFGWFINKYIYDYLWLGLSDELKSKRKQLCTDTDEDLVKLHQFLTDNAAHELQRHTQKVTGLLQAAQHQEHFKALFGKVFESPNQLSMRLVA